jgi:hypothetical protein
MCVVVKGDCKTVIDQMNGKAKPRKQRVQYIEAQSLVQELSDKFECSCTFEHVNRDKNKISDHACRKIMENIQLKEIQILDDMIKDVTKNNRPLAFLPRSKKKRCHFRETDLSKPLALLSDWNGGRIPLSIRPYLLSEIASAANQLNDFVALRIVGETLLSESERWRKSQLFCEELERNHLETFAKQLSFTGLMGMGLKKEALCYVSDVSAFCDLDITTLIKKFQKNIPSYSEKITYYTNRPGLNMQAKNWNLTDVLLADEILLE